MRVSSASLMAFLLSAPLAADSFVFPFSGKSATVSTLSNGSTGSSRHILRSKNTDNSNANEKITVGNTNNESLFDEIYTLTNAFEGIQLQKAALKKEIAAYTAQRTALQDTVDFQNNVVLNTIDQEISRLSAALNNVNGSEKEGAKKKKEKKEKATAESFANLQKQLEDKIALAQEQIDVLTKQIDSKDREIQEYATFETKLKSDYSTLKKELKEAEAALGSRDKVISSLEKDNEQQSEEVKALSESLVSALADSEMEVEKIKSAWEKERSELEGVKERLQNDLDIALSNIKLAKDNAIQAEENAKIAVREQQEQSREFEQKLKQLANAEKKVLKQQIYELETKFQNTKYNFYSADMKRKVLETTLAKYDEKIALLEKAHESEIADLTKRINVAEAFYNKNKDLKNRSVRIIEKFQSRLKRRESKAKSELEELRSYYEKQVSELKKQLNVDVAIESTFSKDEKVITPPTHASASKKKSESSKLPWFASVVTKEPAKAEEKKTANSSFFMKEPDNKNEKISKLVMDAETLVADVANILKGSPVNASDKTKYKEVQALDDEIKNLKAEKANIDMKLLQEQEAAKKAKLDEQLAKKSLVEKERKQQEEEEAARVAEEARLAEEQKMKEEEEAARVAEEARLAEEQKMKEEEEAARVAEEARLAEAENARLLEEKKQEEVEEANRMAEEARLAEIERRRLEEEEYRRAFEARAAEEKRIKEEEEEKKRMAEEARIAEEIRRKEEEDERIRLTELAAIAEEKRIQLEKEENARLAEEARLAEKARVKAEKEEKARLAEERRLQEELESARLAEEARKAEEERIRAAEEEELRLAEEARLAEEQRKIQEQEEKARAAEEARLAEQQRLKEEYIAQKMEEKRLKEEEEARLNEWAREVAGQDQIKEAISEDQAQLESEEDTYNAPAKPDPEDLAYKLYLEWEKSSRSETVQEESESLLEPSLEQESPAPEDQDTSMEGTDLEIDEEKDVDEDQVIQEEEVSREMIEAEKSSTAIAAERQQRSLLAARLDLEKRNPTARLEPKPTFVQANSIPDIEGGYGSVEAFLDSFVEPTTDEKSLEGEVDDKIDDDMDETTELAIQSNDEDEDVDMTDSIIAQRYLYRFSPTEGDVRSLFTIEDRQYFKVNDDKSLSPLGDKSFILRTSTDDESIPDFALGSALFAINGLKDDKDLDEDSRVLSWQSAYAAALYVFTNPKILSGRGLEVSSGTGLAGIMSALGLGYAYPNSSEAEFGDEGEFYSMAPKRLTKLLMTDAKEENILKCIDNLKTSLFPVSKVDLGLLDIKDEVPRNMRNRFDFILGNDCAQDAEALAKAFSYAIQEGPNNIFLHVTPKEKEQAKLKLALDSRLRMFSKIENVVLEKLNLTPLVFDTQKEANAEITNVDSSPSFDDVKVEEVESIPFYVLTGYQDVPEFVDNDTW